MKTIFIIPHSGYHLRAFPQTSILLVNQAFDRQNMCRPFSPSRKHHRDPGIGSRSRTLRYRARRRHCCTMGELALSAMELTGWIWEWMYLVNLVIVVYIAQVCPCMPTAIQSSRIVLAVGILTLAIVTSDGTEIGASVSRRIALHRVGGLTQQRAKEELQER